ncbi:MAG: ATP-binding protein [Cytophagales bacterium]|nr:MAG: ATP-binding protein [Cytophagales bacterium]
MESNNGEEQKLYWQFDVSTFKLLGRELITDRITAVYELVKNCYDANATRVTLEFIKVQTRTNKSKIIIRDDGLGMSLDDIKRKWLVVSTNSKRGKTHSPAPFNRRYIGEKGVGRFAVDKLGGHLHIRTKQKGDPKTLNVIINWGEYERQMKTGQTSLFTSVGNEYYYDKSILSEQGTELIIRNLHETWGLDRIQRLEKQITRIISPTHQLTPPFEIFLQADEYGYENAPVLPEPLGELATIGVTVPYIFVWQQLKTLRFQNSSVDLNIPFKQKLIKQGTLKFDEKTAEFRLEWLDEQPFGPVLMKLYFFDKPAIDKFKAKYLERIDGVKVYRDGIICTPFAEAEANLEKKRDILGIDKRRYNDAFNKISTAEVIGMVDISKDKNPLIIDSTNRQDFIENEEVKAFKDFIIKQLDELVKYKFFRRTQETVRVQNNLRRATAEVKEIAAEIRKITRNNPELQSSFSEVQKLADRVAQVVAEGIKEQETAEKEFQRKEDIYLSLMSLQDYATNMAHSIRLILGKVKHSAEFFKNRYPNPLYEQEFKRIANDIYNEMERMSKAVDFMLSYAETTLHSVEFNVDKFLKELFFEAYSITFEVENINLEVETTKEVKNLTLNTNRKFIEDVLENLISNSVKAMHTNANKRLKCEAYIDDNSLYILLSDNGIGIRKGDEHKVFDIYYTTTAEQGGAGLGLFVAKTRMQALGGKIEVQPSIYSPLGATFKVSLPLKKRH